MPHFSLFLLELLLRVFECIQTNLFILKAYEISTFQNNSIIKNQAVHSSTHFYETFNQLSHPHLAQPKYPILSHFPQNRQAFRSSSFYLKTLHHFPSQKHRFFINNPCLVRITASPCCDFHVKFEHPTACIQLTQLKFKKMCQCLVCDCCWWNFCGVFCAGIAKNMLFCSCWMCKDDALGQIDHECCHFGWRGLGGAFCCTGAICCAPDSVKTWSKATSAKK